MNVTAPLFEPITPGEARTCTTPQGRADIAPSRRAVIEVASFDLHCYANPLVPDIEQGDIRRLTTLERFAWVVTRSSIRSISKSLQLIQALGSSMGFSRAL
jgi:hypothetical protein